ncbi:N-acetyltransferase family protein [Sphaerimonospora sp. CA-214678]|uniref:GNAT family N-acetyltransferase n=1 Tax=Sphaerimonospora sp. CA-214678 TaxID=3240029 RepID=UPI003D9488AC
MQNSNSTQPDGRPAAEPVTLRSASPDDADVITELFVASRAATMPYLPQLHTYEETRWWMRHVVLAKNRVWVAADAASRIVGFAALDGDVLEHLYLHPSALRRGIGSMLLNAVQRASPDGVRLHVFQRNTDAVAFYTHHGFRLVDTNDGSRNEEREPDATYMWTSEI